MNVKYVARCHIVSRWTRVEFERNTTLSYTYKSEWVKTLISQVIILPSTVSSSGKDWGDPQNSLRLLQDEGSIGDWSRPTGRHRDSSSRGYRMVAPAQPTPSTSRGLSSSLGTSKRPSDGKQSYHRQQAKHRLTEINCKLAEAKDRVGRLTRELNARRDLERKAQAAREEISRLKGIRKEYGEHRFQKV